MTRKNVVGVIGLGYVGLPLAIEFGKVTKTFGYDINTVRIEQLLTGLDITKECDAEDFKKAQSLIFTNKLSDLKTCNVYIISVPTPIDHNKQPDFYPLKSACRDVAEVLESGNIVIFESTVYPGATEEVCVPLIEKISGLKFNYDFYVGYSPERINPGDKAHRLNNIVKITSGSTPKTASEIDELYKMIITAGTYKAQSIKVAEAAKVIENTQRDINIALINELAVIFNKMGIDTQEVLDAAGTKWNFLKFLPGLVGGHCIGVDPYYLTHKAEAIGHHPEIILAGRRINDNMSRYVSSQLIKALVKRKFQIDTARVLVMGLTFKENCPDVRNTKSLDVVYELQEYGIKVDVMDPCCDELEVKSKFGIDLVNNPESATYDAVIITVRHQNFIDLGIEKIRSYGHDEVIIYDLKNTFEKTKVDMRL